MKYVLGLWLQANIVMLLHMAARSAGLHVPNLGTYVIVVVALHFLACLLIPPNRPPAS